MQGKIPGPGCQVEISDSIELCIVELMRVNCSFYMNSKLKMFHFIWAMTECSVMLTLWKQAIMTGQIT